MQKITFGNLCKQLHDVIIIPFLTFSLNLEGVLLIKHKKIVDTSLKVVPRTKAYTYFASPE